MRLPRLSLALFLLGLLLVPPSSSRAQLVVSDNFAAFGLFIYGIDATTGAWIGGADLDPTTALAGGVEYGPDGRMYIAAGFTDVIKWVEFDGVTVGSQAVFTAGNGGSNPLDGPFGLAWGAYDGKNVLFVHDATGAVRAYDDNGAYLGTPFIAPEGPASFGYGLAIGYENVLYVPIDSNQNSRVYRVDGQTGEILDDQADGDDHFVQLTDQSPSGLQWRPYDAAVAPNGDVYLTAVANQTFPGGNPLVTGGALFRIRPDSTGRYTDGTVIQSVNDPAGTWLNLPKGVTIGDDGMIYVVNAAEFKVQRFTEDLVFDQTFSSISGAQFHMLSFIPTDCRDGVDNDGDGDIDLADSGCTDDFDNAETDGTDQCDDGIDNDGDGVADTLDFGCLDGNGLETSPTFPCDDGIDNDGDGRTDFDPVTYANPGDETTPPAGTGDPGCGAPTWTTESPQCQNGANDDGQTGTDYDGAAFLNGGTPIDVVDPNCVNKPWARREKPGCGASISPIEGPHTPGLAVLMLLLALCKPNPRRSRSTGNH